MREPFIVGVVSLVFAGLLALISLAADLRPTRGHHSISLERIVR